MLDSLVRVSRRVYENHFVKIANAWSRRPPVSSCRLYTALPFKPTKTQGGPPAALRNALSWYLKQPRSMVNGYKLLLKSRPPSANFLLRDYLILTHPTLQ